MERYKLVAVNADTGEVTWFEDDVLILGRKPYRVDKGYVKLFITFLYDLLDEEITGKAVRLLVYMISRLEYNTYEITLIPQEAIKDLGIARKTFYNWLNVLIEKEIIRKISRYKYKLEPYKAIKGQTAKVKEC